MSIGDWPMFRIIVELWTPNANMHFSPRIENDPSNHVCLFLFVWFLICSLEFRSGFLPCWFCILRSVLFCGYSFENKFVSLDLCIFCCSSFGLESGCKAFVAQMSVYPKCATPPATCISWRHPLKSSTPWRGFFCMANFPATLHASTHQSGRQASGNVIANFASVGQALGRRGFWTATTLQPAFGWAKNHFKTWFSRACGKNFLAHFHCSWLVVGRWWRDSDRPID